MASEEFGPVVQRTILTTELKKIRRDLNLNQDEVAAALEWSPSKLLRIEGGGVGITTTDLRALLSYYGLTDPDRVGEFVELARGARRRGWWTSYKSLTDQEYLNFVGYEAGASLIKISQGLIVPGLLQIEPYARSVTSEYLELASLTAEDLDQVRAHVNDLVGLRMQRQSMMASREKQPQQYFVLDEAVIRRHVGVREDPDLMPAQLRHLVAVAERDNVTIEVIPFERGAHYGMQGPFTLLQFEAALGDVLYLESARRGDLTIADPAKSPEIAKYHEIFDRLRQLSLGPEGSLELIRQVERDMPRRVSLALGRKP